MPQFGAPVECFMVVAVEEQEAWLRRFDRSDDPSEHLHQAMVHIGRIPLRYSESGYIEQTDPADYEGDERWPTHCAEEGCEYEFSEDDTWQVLGRQLWERMPNLASAIYRPQVGELGTVPPLPEPERRIIDAVHDDPAGVEPWGAGAMYDSWWLRGMVNYRGPDGLTLTVKLPDGRPWVIDGPASTGGRWTRTGTPPKVTAQPSISSHSSDGQGGMVETYHGWLRDGWLVSV